MAATLTVIVSAPALAASGITATDAQGRVEEFRQGLQDSMGTPITLTSSVAS